MRSGGRAATFALQDVIAAGVRIGLADLTVHAVANALGVTTTAVYRHVPSRSELESLIGEHILGELSLVDDPAEPSVAHLVSFAGQLRHFTLQHPGSAEYLQRLFPRGPSGIRLLEHQIEALGRRGYDPAAATVLSSAMATVSLGVTIAEQERIAHFDERAAGAAWTAMAASPLVSQALTGIPDHTPQDYFELLMTATAQGLVAQLPPGQKITIPRKAN